MISTFWTVTCAVPAASPAAAGGESVLLWLVWGAFLLFVLTMVMLDLGVFHRHAHVISTREALAWTVVWVVMALAFNVVVYFLYERNWLGWTNIAAHHLSGHEAATVFFTGYVLEKSLSADNIFVIAMIFSYFGVPRAEQHRVLFWGILGAVILRGVMIALGTALIARFEWIVYVFGAIVIASALKMLFSSEEDIHPDRNLFVRLTRYFYPVSGQFHGSRFFVKLDGRHAVTPLFLALVLVESSDVMFAVDSIPAVFAVTRDPFIVFTSNIFAILGLRAMFFVLAGLLHQFRYLKVSLVVVLGYVGVKMLASHHYKIPNLVSLTIIAAVLLVGILASIWVGRREAAARAGIAPEFPAGVEQRS